MKKLLALTVIVLIVSSCKTIDQAEELSESDKWALGWRIIASNWNGDYQLGEMQFDSLLNGSKDIEPRFIMSGLEILAELDKKEKLIDILESQDQDMLQQICSKDLFTKKLKNVEACTSIEKEKVGNPELQLELIKMYVDDPAVRSNIKDDLINKYGLDKSKVANGDQRTVDARNRKRLKEIFAEFGFPTKEMVGRDAMNGMFFTIQHADQDTEWQKSQLSHIEKAVKEGDLEGDRYAYLCDRIKKNSGEKQRYGTQFKNVDPEKGLAELAETEDIENLDKRRMEVGLMPIAMYKKVMLKNVKK